MVNSTTNKPIILRLWQTHLHILVLLVLTVIAYCVNWTHFNGGYLSDTYSLYRSCYNWHESGEFWKTLIRFFWNGVPNGVSAMYRPIGLASMCSEFKLIGDSPFVLKLLQFTYHLINAGLLYVFVKIVFKQHKQVNIMAVFAMALFLFNPVTPEVSMWIVGRYDVLVQMFMLLCCLFHWKNKKITAFIFLLLALASKESAIVIPAMLFSMSYFNSVSLSTNHLTRFIQKFRQALLETWIYWLLALLYMFGRRYLFGGALHVYAQEGTFLGNLMHNITVFPHVFSQLTLGPWSEDSSVVNGFWLLFFVFTGLSAWLSYRNKILNMWFMLFSWIIMTLLALLTQVGSVDASGTGARILYNVATWWSVLVALPLLFIHRKYSVLFAFYAMYLFYIQSLPSHQWSQASGVSKQLLASIAKLQPLEQKKQWSMVLIPGNIGVALVGRNAQGSFVLPPFQDKRLLDEIVPFVAEDLEIWRNRINTNFVVNFKQDVKNPNQFPNKYYCTQKSGEVIEIPIRQQDLSSEVKWNNTWQRLTKQFDCYF
jgi:hypothetical protein